MELALIYILMEVDTRVNGLKEKDMGQLLLLVLQAKSLLGCSKWEKNGERAL